jgi:hypothetical protein
MVDGMDLLERYIQAVGQYLPSAAREDTLAELRANLLEQMDARSEELGRSLTDADASAILLAHGRPEVVAARYLPQQSLIGPGLFPTYILTLRNALPFVAFIYCIIRGISFITSPDPGALLSHIVQAILQFVPTVLLFWAIVTMVFAVIEYAQSHFAEGEKWSPSATWEPAKLPPLKAALGPGKPKSLASRVADLTVHCLWTIYVLVVPTHPFILLGPGVYFLDSLGVSFAPVWHTFLFFFIALLFVQLVTKVIAVVRESHPWIRPLNIVTNLLSIAACATLAFAREYFVPVSHSADLQRLADVNHAMALAFRVALFFAVLGLLTDGWKSVKRFLPTDPLVF